MHRIFIITLLIAGLSACEGRLQASADDSLPGAVLHPGTEEEPPAVGPGATIDEPAQPIDIDACAELDPTPVADVPARLLTATELNNALEILFPTLERARVEMPGDSRVGSFVLNAREQISATHVRDFRLMAEDVAVAAAAAIDVLAPCDLADESAQAECADAAIVTFAERAFRRGLEETERSALVGLWEAGSADGGHAAGMRLVYEAVLQAPSFMYVTEDATADVLTDQEVAQRMAALFWRSIPDDALAEAAKNGELLDPVRREEHARRMLGDERAKRMMRNLVLQWLGLDRLDEEGFAETALLDAMGAETVRLVDHVVEERQSSWADLLTSPYTFVDETMAAHYGVSLEGAEEVTPGVFRVEMPDRAGLLTHAGFLVMHQGPVHRGLAIRKAILCGNVPGPAGVDTEAIPTEPDESERSKSLKRLESASCRGCHAMMDPLGLTFETYGTLGQPRTEDRHGNPVSGEGTLIVAGDQTPVANAVELARELADSEDSRECIAHSLFTWTFARPAESRDGCTVARIEDALARSGDNLQEALVQVVAHEMFVRRGTTTTGEAP